MAPFCPYNINFRAQHSILFRRTIPPFSTWSITVTDIVGEKRIDLAYPFAVVSMFSDSIQYEFAKPWTIDLESRSKQIAAGTYTRRELINLGKGKIEITQFDNDSRIKRMNKLAGITEMVFNSDGLDSSNNLENGSPNNTLLTYHVTSYEDPMHFEPYAPQYKKLKNGEIVSLTLRITHIKISIVTEGPGTTVVLHI